MNENVSAWADVAVLKNGLIDNIVKEIGDRKIDLSGEYMKLFAVEHHCNEMVEGDVQMISSSGFTLDSYCDELEWKDMIVEDLAMVLDYLRTGNW